MNSQPVELSISGISTPGASSTSVRPVSLFTSNTHFSVMIRSTQRAPVNGRLHSFNILWSPFLSFYFYFSFNYRDICLLVLFCFLQIKNSINYVNVSFLHFWLILLSMALREKESWTLKFNHSFVYWYLYFVFI